MACTSSCLKFCICTESFTHLNNGELGSLIDRLTTLQNEALYFRRVAESFLAWYGVMYRAVIEDVADEHFKPPAWLNWAQVSLTEAALHGYLNCGDCGLFALSVGEVLRRRGLPVEWWDNGAHVYFSVGEKYYDSFTYLTGKTHTSHKQMFGFDESRRPNPIDPADIEVRCRLQKQDLEFFEVFLMEQQKC
jgi:hypothetical protein